MERSRGAEGGRVAQEIVQIRSALKAAGYSTRKRPKQAVWTIGVDQGKSYYLTFQPAPISAWVLHPLDDAPTYHHLSNLIGLALTQH
ncbi:hypothetical protein H6F93_22550 [Leptolyngbya sp. FACHB-671]|uniref:hypothetical protein n=1 Tax=Leptolyngbya sp. FACHB-671 TaxID=2692812 RepID=UPI0016876027|nr:hypothetical protein [Leptolyngbya sp. FACHB-671]MBD2070257.1 hypothetical protein [Leptolyngbya sp. FACHB-671]